MERKNDENPSTSKDELCNYVDEIIETNKIVIFSKTWCPYCTKAKNLLNQYGLKFFVVEIDNEQYGPQIQAFLETKSGQKTVPNIFINQVHIGGFSNLYSLSECGVLEEIVQAKSPAYNYDLVVIGGGSGGIAAAKEARKYGKKVAICDFVTPSPQGSTWGFGGTCVNVGCIPKKLMHRASLIHHDIDDAPYFGWKTASAGDHNWETLVENVTSYIKSLNFKYRTSFKKLGIPIYNAHAEFVDAHTLKLVNNQGKAEMITSLNFIIATGLRPLYPNIPGAREHGITSDDIFLNPKHPGKTLIVGASYIALECAGFLASLGIKCTVMVRSILLRGFDQEMGEKIGEVMTKLGVQFLMKYTPVAVITKPDSRLMVEAVGENGLGYSDTFDTVMFAIGREPRIENLGLDKLNISINPKNRKIIVNAKEQTSQKNIFVIGDIADVGIELTPAAIKAGKLLAQRLYGMNSILMDYTNIPTTVFTPIEYGCVGLSEETALELHPDKVEVFHNFVAPLESVLSKRFDEKSFAKLICIKNAEKALQVVGVHYLGPNAGEVIQGYALGVKLGVTKEQFDSVVGIHPTCAEVFTTMSVSKSSGEKLDLGGC